jgi:hypothetical protein
MDPIQRPVITRQDVQQARVDQLSTMAAAVGSTLGITAANYRFNAPFGPVVQKPLQMLVTGVKATPTETGRAALSFPKASIFAAAMPAPIGYVPPEWYGLHPAVVRRTLGFGAGKKPIIFEPSDERKRVFEAKLEAERIAGRVLDQPVIFGLSGGFPFHKLPAGQLNITDEELAFLESLPPDITNAQKLIPGLRARRSDFRVDPYYDDVLPAGGASVAIPPVLVLPAEVPIASIQTEHIKPIAAAALANQAAAEGIRRGRGHARAAPR